MKARPLHLRVFKFFVKDNASSVYKGKGGKYFFSVDGHNWLSDRWTSEEDLLDKGYKIVSEQEAIASAKTIIKNRKPTFVEPVFFVTSAAKKSHIASKAPEMAVQEKSADEEFEQVKASVPVSVWSSSPENKKTVSNQDIEDDFDFAPVFKSYYSSAKNP